MNLADFDALSFDCYGTLIDWEQGIGEVLGGWASDRGATLATERLLELYAACEAEAEHRMPAAPYPEVLAAAMRAVGDRLGIPVEDRDAQRFAQSVPDWPAFPDSAAALRLLARHYRLIILSNVDRASFAGSNSRLGVDFAAVITAEEVGSYKPSLRNFETLLDRTADMGIPEGGLLHVAQSLFHDHVPAKQIGLPTVWINRRQGRNGWGATPPAAGVEADWTFDSMEAFAAACAEAAS